MDKKKFLAVMLSLSLVIGNSSVFVLAQNVDQEFIEDDQDRLPDYILGRPMTDGEKREQESMVPELYDQPVPDDIAEPVLHGEQRAGTYSQRAETFDLRELGAVTSVKNQAIDGTCWAFAAIAMTESSMLQYGGTADDMDLSEEHLAYFFYDRVNDPLGNTARDKNVINLSMKNYKTIGGNPQLASKFLSTWSGPADEETVPYSSEASHLDDSLAYVSEAHLQDAYFIDASVEEIKEALYTTQQPVGVNYYHTGAYYNVETAAYCYPVEGTGINHAVAIVGWDDTYKKENFLPASKVASDGAWIVKNSWGDSHGDGGYIYISYEDQRISGAVTARSEPSDNYDHNYQYDGSSGSNAMSVPVGASHANVFLVKGNPSGSEVLKAAGIMVKSADAELSVDVYTDLKDPADPASGTHAVIGQPVTTRHSGYYTFPLQQEVVLREGSYFSIIFTNRSDTAKSFFIESSADSGWIKFEADAETGQSFYRAGEGENWKDMGGQQYVKGKSVNARIKAYTVDSPEILVPEEPSPTPTVSPSPSPTEEPSPTPTEEPSPSPTEEPSPTPTVNPSPSPTEEPSPTLTVSPSPTPTVRPSPSPSVNVRTPGKVSLGKVSLTAKGVKLVWGKTSNALRYEVYRKKMSGGGWKLLKTVSGTSYEDRSVLSAVSYSYRVRAVNVSGSVSRYGAYSGEKKILTKPDTPVKISVKRSGRASASTKAAFTMGACDNVSVYYIYQYDRRAKKYKIAYRIKGDKLYSYQRSAKKYKKIGAVKKSKGKLSCTLTKIDLKTYSKQFFKVRAYVSRSGVGERYSGYSSKITLKR